MRAPEFTEKFKIVLNKCLGFFKTIIKPFSSNNPEKGKLNKLIRSTVALALMVVLFVTMTFSWMMSSFTSSITNNDYITIDADAGLQMNYGEEQNPDGSININKALRDGFKLHECSSADGRNIFFPIYDYSPNGDKSFSNGVSTSDLLFREATANDKNTKYISVDFTLSSKEATDVWLSSSSFINCKSSQKTANAIRIAFVNKSVDGNSTVFSSAESKEYTQYDTTDTVKSISTLGVSSTESVTPHAINEYIFGNANGENGEDLVLFHIDAGKTIKASMIVWLEGTDPDCTNEVLNISDLNIYIKFTTSYEELRTITFIDNTLEKWVDGHNDNLDTNVYLIDTATNKLHKMDTEKDSYVWTVDIPTSITNVKFVRYDPIKQGDSPTEWNYWDAGDLGSCSTYYAIGHSGGLWATNFTPQTITIFDGTNDGWLRGSNESEFKVKYNVTDGNGNSVAMDYKMSYQHELNRYSIIIPKQVTQVSFHRVNKDMTETGHNWTYLNRGSNYFFNITGVNKGYWSTRYIYINDAANVKSGVGFAAYFYSNSSDSNQWTGMHSKSPSGYYVAVVPMDKQSGVVFTKYNTSRDPSWDNIYNQSLNTLENFGSNNRFTTKGYTGEKDGVNNYYIDGYWDKVSE